MCRTGAILSPGDTLNVPTDDGLQQMVMFAGDPGFDRGPRCILLEDGAGPSFFLERACRGAGGEVAYEVSVKTPGGAWTPVGASRSTFMDFPAERSVADLTEGPNPVRAGVAGETGRWPLAVRLRDGACLLRAA